MGIRTVLAAVADAEALSTMMLKIGSATWITALDDSERVVRSHW